MKRNILFIIFAGFISLLFIFLFVIHPVFALTASSPSYSVGRFSTGMATSNISSANYQGISLLESAGTTRNAESDSLTVNVGFFENTPYYKTVSINSYSIYPSSPKVLSNVRFYISALNADYVWANITRPDSVVETIQLTNNDYEYYTVGLVGRYYITFYANSSIGTLSSLVTHFDVTEEEEYHPSGGGGGTRTIIEECYYLWDCTPWSSCSGGNQTRTCVNVGTCNGTTNKPIEKINCTESLFDISLKLNNLKLGEDKSLIFNLNLTEKFGVEMIDVHIKYSIINASGYEVFSQIETKSIKNNLSYEKDISDFHLSDGEYILRVDVLYGNLQRAFTEQKFKIVSKEIGEVPVEKEHFFNMFNYNLVFLLAGLILILAVIIFLLAWLIRKPKRDKEKIEEYLADGLNAIENKDIYKAIDCYEKIKKIYKLKYDPSHEVRNKIKKLYDKVRENKYLLK